MPPPPNPSPPGPRVIYWFRTDLRLHDSPALHAALALRPSALYLLWTWDPHYIYRARVGPNRLQFLLDCQRDLSASLTALHPAQKLLVARGPPLLVIPALARAWAASHVVFERDSEPYARGRDAGVAAALEGWCEVVTRAGRTLWDPDEVVRRNGGRPTMSAQQLEAAGRKVGEIARPLGAPGALPGPGDTGLAGLELEEPAREPDVNEGDRTGEEASYRHGLAGPEGDFAMVTLEELGLPAATTPHRGGETRALAALAAVLRDAEFTATFEKPKTSPAAFEPASTCLLSAHLHFGSLSVREFWWGVQGVLDAYEGTASTPPVSLHGQLLFRDMYFAAQAALGHRFAQTHGNPACRFVPWHLPSRIDAATGRATGEHDVDSAEAEQRFRRWRDGRTGFPWIDALMRQLRREGWIHHLGRHSVACFLTRGGCYVSWERGAEVFEELLLDHEPACNAGNWQWLSCTAFFAQFHRCYSPVAFGRKWDKEGALVRRYCPELRELPAKYIYEPWKAPLLDQKRAGVAIKGDGSRERDEDGTRLYPKPMLDFDVMRKRCMDGMKEAYDRKLYGDSKEVKDGSWRKLFADGGEGPTEGERGGAGGTAGEDDHDGADASPKRKRGPEKKDDASHKGAKRARGQGTLDGAVKRTKR